MDKSNIKQVETIIEFLESTKEILQKEETADITATILNAVSRIRS